MKKGQKISNEEHMKTAKSKAKGAPNMTMQEYEHSSMDKKADRKALKKINKMAEEVKRKKGKR